MCKSATHGSSLAGEQVQLTLKRFLVRSPSSQHPQVLEAKAYKTEGCSHMSALREAVVVCFHKVNTVQKPESGKQTIMN